MNARKVSPPLIIFAPAIIAAAIFIAYVFVWLAGARQMRTSVDEWLAEQRARGATANVEKISATGFPFFLRGVLKGVEMRSGAWAASAPRVFIDADPFAPRRLILSSREPFLIDFGGEGAWRVSAPDGRASLARDAERGWEVNAEATRTELHRLDREGHAQTGAFLLSAAPNAIDPSRIFFGVDISDLTLSEGATTARLDQASFAVAADGMTAAGTSIEAWRAAGGAIEIQNVRLAADGATAEFAGSLAVGTNGYLEGRIDALISKPQPIAGWLAAAGLIRPRDVDNARTALSLIAIAGGGKIAAPLTLENGEVSLAGVKIGEMKPVIGADQGAQP